MAQAFLTSFRPGLEFRDVLFRQGLGIHALSHPRDKNFVSVFLQHAEEIFQAAREAGPEDCEMSILVSRDGNIHMLAGSDWELEPLRVHHGAKAAYRIRRKGGGVRVEARSADESCLLQTRQPAVRMQSMLYDFPQYLMIRPLAPANFSVSVDKEWYGQTERPTSNRTLPEKELIWTSSQ